MSTTKSKGSKLDEFAAELLAWESSTPPVTLEAMRSRLAQRGCSVSSGRLSDFLSAQRQQAQTEARMAKVLGSIASGAQTVQRVESEFAKNAPPELATLIRLLQVLIMELSTQAFADPALLELVASLMKPVLEFAKLTEKREDRALDREKFLAALKPKLELAMDEFAAALKANPALLAEFNEKFRPKVNAAMTK